MAVETTAQTRAAHPVIQRFFEVSLYLLLFTGFATLAGTGKLDTWSLLLGVLLLLVKGFFLLRDGDILIPERWTTYLTLLYVIFFALDYFLISQTFLGALVHMVLFAVMVKLFSVHRDRDYVYLAVLSFGMVLAAAVLTVDSLFFAIFCLFVLLAVMTFVSMEMRRSWIAAEPSAEMNGAADLRRLPGFISSACVALVASIVIGTVVLFFLIPRKASTGYLSSFAARTEISTGFSEEVQLGEIGQIQQSNSVVMHVKFAPNTEVPRDLRWRGVALVHFDGRRWTGPQDEGEPLNNPNGIFPAMIEPPRMLSTAGRAQVRYDVSLEPFGARVFFVLPDAVIVQGRYRALRIDTTGSIFNNDPAHAVTDYQVLSQLPPRMPANLSQRGEGAVDPSYLQLPPYLDARIPARAQQITANENGAYLKASAIERYLSTNYGYTLQLPSATPKDPIANFLFERKQGHCEYFASSMAVMLRTLGIPSRVVNGFRGGEYNDVTGSYIVRAKDAHSWVEAYFSGYGWYTFDPTPAGASESGTWNRMYLYMDAMREFWRQWIVNYDMGHQTTLGFAAVRHGRSAFEHLRVWMESFYDACLRRAKTIEEDFQQHVDRWAMWSALVLTMLALLIGGPKLYRALRRFRLVRRPRLDPHSAATIWYQRALKLLSRRGVRKTAAQTPQEFVARVPAMHVRERLSSFTVYYERARFGNSGEDAEKLPELYRELEEAVKR